MKKYWKIISTVGSAAWKVAGTEIATTFFRVGTEKADTHDEYGCSNVAKLFEKWLHSLRKKYV